MIFLGGYARGGGVSGRDGPVEAVNKSANGLLFASDGTNASLFASDTNNAPHVAMAAQHSDLTGAVHCF